MNNKKIISPVGIRIIIVFQVVLATLCFGYALFLLIGGPIDLNGITIEVANFEIRGLESSKQAMYDYNLYIAFSFTFINLMFIPLLFFIKDKINSINNTKKLFLENDQKTLLRYFIISGVFFILYVIVPPLVSNFYVMDLTSDNVIARIPYYLSFKFDFVPVVILVVVYGFLQMVFKISYKLQNDLDEIV